MKIKKLNQNGFAHWILPAIVIVVVGAVGAYMLTNSHADALLSCSVQVSKQGKNIHGTYKIVNSSAKAQVVSFTYGYSASQTGSAQPATRTIPAKNTILGALGNTTIGTNKLTAYVTQNKTGGFSCNKVINP